MNEFVGLVQVRGHLYALTREGIMYEMELAPSYPYELRQIRKIGEFPRER